MVQSQDILIKNACVITACGPVFENGFVHIRDGKILAFGKHRSLDDHAIKRTDIIDARGSYVLPGFINPHMHLYSTFARGMPCGRMKTFGQVLKNFWWRLDRALTIEDIYVSALIGGIESVKAGVTTLIDHHASYGAISGSLRAISDALDMLGLRSSLCFEISDRAGRRARDAALIESALWLEHVADQPEGYLHRGMVGLHASMTLSDPTLEAAYELMDKYNAGAHVHVAEGIEDIQETKKRFNTMPVERFFKSGILREGSLAVHCVHVGERDIGILKSSAATVVHNPLSNLNNAVGMAPVPRMFERKIPIVIGTDGMSASVAGDIELAAVLHRIQESDAQFGGDVIQRAVWKTAPDFASKIFGLKIGVIEKGAAADVVITDAKPPTPVTSENAWWHVLFGALNSPIRTTIIAGKVRMKDFQVFGVDEEISSRRAVKLSKKLWRKIGS